jgi:pimeloyl-ACP methyl ester carboxylesterase
MASKYYSWHHGDVHYQKRGMGDPLLLVHNVYPGASLEEYEHNFDELARHYTVYAIDLLGYGRSAAPRMKYTANLFTELIFDFAREEIAKPCHVVSAGLSCAYVTEVAAWRSNLFQKLVFICPRSEPTGLDIPRWLAPVRHFMLSTPTVANGYYETATGRHELGEFLKGVFYNPKHVTQALVDRLYDNSREAGSMYPFASLLTGYLDCHLLSSLPKVKNPILLLWGRQARPTPVEHSVRLLALARDSHLEVVENAGAWVHFEQSAIVNKLIERYLEGEIATSRGRVAETALLSPVHRGAAG